MFCCGPRLLNRIRLIDKLDSEMQAAPIFVPGDGNCMVWSLKYFLKERVASAKSDFTSKDALGEMKQVRTMIKNMWISVANTEEWQHLFVRCCQNVQNVLETPRKNTKRKTSVDDGGIDIVTPPRVSPEPEKGRAERTRVSETRWVPFGKPQPKSSTLRAPGTGKMQACLEPNVPDLEDAFHQVQQKVPENRDCLQVDFGDDVEDDFGEIHEPMGARSTVRKKHFTRTCKSKIVTKKELTDQAFKELLGQRKVSYHAFLAFHRQHAKVKEAAVRPKGGYAFLTQTLRSNTWPECDLCRSFLDSCNLSQDKVQEAHAGFAQADLLASHGAPKADPADDLLKGNQDQLEACKKYIENMPLKEFELIVEGTSEKPVVKYKCFICTTKGQPDGKLNHLGKPSLNSLKRYLHVHSQSYLHVQNRAIRASQNEDDHEVEKPEPSTCNGHLVFDFSSL